MNDLETLKKYVEFYEVEEEPKSDTVSIMCLDSNTIDNPEQTSVNFEVKQISTSLQLSEEEMFKTVDDILTSFTKVVSSDLIETEKAKMYVARTSRRAPANIQYKNAWYYKGNMKTDSPLFVVKYKNRYGVIKHPKFDDYGFVLESEN